MRGESRTIVDPRNEADVIVREAPFEKPEGGISRRLKSWIFEEPSGRYICAVPMHRGISLRRTPAHELEELFELALNRCR